MALAETDIADAVNALSMDVGGKSLPSPLAKLAGNERINIYIKMDAGEDIVVGLITENGVVKSMAVAEVKEPTVKVYSSESVLRGIILSKDQPSALLKAVKDKKITYEGIGFKNKVKLKIASGLMRLAALFQKDDMAKVEVFAKEKDSDESKGDSGDSSQNDDQGQEIDNADEERGDDKEDTDTSEDTDSEDDDTITGNAVAEVEEVEKKAEPKPKKVNLVEGGFSTESLKIRAGETVEWKNVRSGRFKQALIIGTRNCREIKSDIYDAGESFSWTFNERETCVIADGIYTTETMKIIVD
ncbi:hypothetical protein HYT52_04505 [Candidatus Woesearchaeota archaeon]|nr:hypothetical protein [Candidatus Woesearchaeota archaeon]